MGIFDVSSDTLFTAGLTNSAQLDYFAQQALSKGLNLFISKKYDEAITSFKRAVGMSPRSTTAVNAYDYMARSYVTKGDNNSAIKAYQQALKIDSSRDDLHAALGNVYIANNQNALAVKEYQAAANLNSNSANHYSLGQGYLANGQYDQALSEFQKVRSMDPSKPYGDFGMGQALAKLGRNDEAIAAFDRAIGIQYNYWNAYSEKGFTLVDMGQADKATEIANQLQTSAPNLASTLNSYIYEKSAPKMSALYSSSVYAPFLSALGPGTQVANMGLYLSSPNAQKTVSMVFKFSKQMDQQSIENAQNWSITRNLGTGMGDGYNLSMPLPSTEISLSATPDAVYYDNQAMTATVLFKIQQNATGTGTIDPSHIKFTFNGKDVLGLAMDSSADSYAGFSGFA